MADTQIISLDCMENRPLSHIQDNTTAIPATRTLGGHMSAYFAKVLQPFICLQGIK